MINMNPFSIHIFYLYAPNNIASNIKQKKNNRRQREINEQILYPSGR